MSPLGYSIILVALLFLVAFFVIKENFAYGKNQNPLISTAVNPLLTPAVILPTKTPTPANISNTPAPTVLSSTVTNNKDFQYPNSLKKAQLDNNLIFESYDNPFEITSWYQQKIKQEGFKITSSIQTTTNGDVLNKIIGSSDNKEIRVEISKVNKEPVVRITLSVNF